MQVATSLCATMPVTTQPTTTSWPVIPMPMSKHQVQTLFSPGRGQTSSTNGFVSDQVPGGDVMDASSHGGSNCTRPVYPNSSDGTRQHLRYNFVVLFDSAYDFTRSTKT